MFSESARCAQISANPISKSGEPSETASPTWPPRA